MANDGVSRRISLQQNVDAPFRRAKVRMVTISLDQAIGAGEIDEAFLDPRSALRPHVASPLWRSGSVARPSGDTGVDIP